MITLSAAEEAREMLRDCLRQISVHSEIAFIRSHAARALTDFSEANVLLVIHVPVFCRHRDKLVARFNDCNSAGGFNAHAE